MALTRLEPPSPPAHVLTAEPLLYPVLQCGHEDLAIGAVSLRGLAWREEALTRFLETADRLIPGRYVLTKLRRVGYTGSWHWMSGKLYIVYGLRRALEPANHTAAAPYRRRPESIDGSLEVRQVLVAYARTVSLVLRGKALLVGASVEAPLGDACLPSLPMAPSLGALDGVAPSGDKLLELHGATSWTQGWGSDIEVQAEHEKLYRWSQSNTVDDGFFSLLRDLEGVSWPQSEPAQRLTMESNSDRG